MFIVTVVAATLFLKVPVWLLAIVIAPTLFTPLDPPISPVNVLLVPVMLIVPSPAEAPAIAGAIVTLLAPAKTIVAVPPDEDAKEVCYRGKTYK